VVGCDDQPEVGDGQKGRYGVAERPVSHRHLSRFLEHRIADPCLLRVIHRFLKAGVMEDGAVTASTEGTPQGGLVSPVLANLFALRAGYVV